MRGRKRKCAIHTNTKFAAIAEAQAAASEPWNPDRRKRGPEHVVLLKRAVNKAAYDSRITPAQFKKRIGWQ